MNIFPIWSNQTIYTCLSVMSCYAWGSRQIMMLQLSFYSGKYRSDVHFLCNNFESNKDLRKCKGELFLEKQLPVLLFPKTISPVLLGCCENYWVEVAYRNIVVQVFLLYQSIGPIQSKIVFELSCNEIHLISQRYSPSMMKSKMSKKLKFYGD